MIVSDCSKYSSVAQCALWWERTKTGPLAELLSVWNLDERDLVLGAESDDELLVSLLLASLVEDTHVCLAAVESLGSLTETAGKTIVHQGELENTLESIQNGHLSLWCLLSRDLDLILNLDGWVLLFYVRLLNLVSWLCWYSAVATAHRVAPAWIEVGYPLLQIDFINPLEGIQYIPSCMDFRVMSKDPRSWLVEVLLTLPSCRTKKCVPCLAYRSALAILSADSHTTAERQIFGRRTFRSPLDNDNRLVPSLRGM